MIDSTRITSRCSAILPGIGSLLLALQGWSCAIAANHAAVEAALHTISCEEIHRHIEVLADDVYEGREAGSRGGQAAARYLVEHLEHNGLQPAGEEGTFRQKFNDQCCNLLALLPGDDPALDKELVVIGAHYDHVGHGRKKPKQGALGAIHNGADDNASGTSVILELIEAFSQSRLRTRRSILFALWDSEEKGLLGSKHWVAHPTMPLDCVRFNFTVDMVGRLRDERLIVIGTRSGFGSRRLLSDTGVDSMKLDFSWDVKANSDHWPFMQQGIPAALFHTGLHADYHRPTDDADRINQDGMQQIARYILSALIRAANENTLPKFREAVHCENDGLRKDFEQSLPPVSVAGWPNHSSPPRLGFTWREDNAEPGTVFLTRVVEGSPAAAAGLLVADRIYEVNDQRFHSSSDFQKQLHAIVENAPQQVDLLVERQGIFHDIPLHLASSARIGEHSEPAHSSPAN
ncbi:MAG: M20/M25/M40 family metallo-hydrolase [Pirellulales bacterium]|nr:M20/M25/M40 family metallo-hydrolase [Pirellulales bacterium]